MDTDFEFEDSVRNADPDYTLEILIEEMNARIERMLSSGHYDLVVVYTKAMKHLCLAHKNITKAHNIIDGN